MDSDTIDDAEHRARVVFRSLGSSAKRALAHREANTVRRHLDGLDHAVRAAVLVACDAYEAAWRSRRGGG